jgi:spermidine/putrescine transport system ATP-binding protein
MNDGRVEHIGTPAAVYESPATVFVADFLGVSNLMDAQAVEGDAGHCVVSVGDFHLRAACGDLRARGPVKLVARPERVQLLEHGADGDNCLPGMVERTVYVGASLQVMVHLATGAQLQASITNTGCADAYRQGTPVSVHIPPDALRILDGTPAAPSPTAPGEEAAADAPAPAPAAG